MWNAIFRGSLRVSLPACGRKMSPGAHRLKRRRGREVLLRLRVVKVMVKRHGLEAIARLIAAQRLAKSVQVPRGAIDQQLGDSLRVGERTGREKATQVGLDDPGSSPDGPT